MAGKRSPTSHRTPEQMREKARGYNSTPEQIKHRTMQNAARAEMEKKVGKAALKGKDVGHKKPLRSGGGNSPSNLTVQSPKYNRGWEAGGKNR